MSVRRTTIATLAGLTAAGSLLCAPAAVAAPESEVSEVSVDAAPTSLADVLAADGQSFDDHHSDFDILDAAVTAVLDAKPDSPLAVLADGSTPLTAFLPEDNGFQALAYEIQGPGEYPESEQAAFDIVATLGVDAIERVLLFHVIPGQTLTYRNLASSRQGRVLVTGLDGQTVTITVFGKINGSLGTAIVNDGTDYYGQALNQRNINRGNPQVAHSIVLDTLRPAAD